ncbi:hypothetical protein ACOSP7_020929 [Xanthoceras sorbifolium]
MKSTTMEKGNVLLRLKKKKKGKERNVFQEEWFNCLGDDSPGFCASTHLCSGSKGTCSPIWWWRLFVCSGLAVTSWSPVSQIDLIQMVLVFINLLLEGWKFETYGFKSKYALKFVEVFCCKEVTKF